jgi:hypothetical protein
MAGEAAGRAGLEAVTMSDINLPAIISGAPSAKLPDVYTSAQKALSECYQIDECKGWSDKAIALASYARQANDTTLLRLARSIQKRAVRRQGELLREIEPAHGTRTDLQPHIGAHTRSRVARDAGLSKHQKDTALSMAAVPEAAFSEALETRPDQTAAELAAEGVQHRGNRDEGEVQQPQRRVDGLHRPASPALRALAQELAPKSERVKIKAVTLLMQMLGIYDGVMKAAVEEFAKTVQSKAS